MQKLVIKLTQQEAQSYTALKESERAGRKEGRKEELNRKVKLGQSDPYTVHCLGILNFTTAIMIFFPITCMCTFYLLTGYLWLQSLSVLSLHLSLSLCLSLLCSHCQSVNQQNECDEYVTAAVVVYNIKSPKPQAT